MKPLSSVSELTKPIKLKIEKRKIFIMHNTIIIRQL